MFIIWLMFYFLFLKSTDSGSAFWSIVSMNTLSLLVISFFIIYSDLKFYAKNTYRYVFIIILFFLLALLLAAMIQKIVPLLVAFGPHPEKGFWDSVVIIVPCALLYWMAHKIFLKRNSYVK